MTRMGILRQKLIKLISSINKTFLDITKPVDRPHTVIDIESRGYPVWRRNTVIGVVASSGLVQWLDRRCVVWGIEEKGWWKRDASDEVCGEAEEEEEPEARFWYQE